VGESEEIMKETIETMLCADCGAVIDCEEYFNADDRTICEDCFEEYYSTCDNCGDVVNRDDLISIDGGREYVCETCADSYYYQCDDCGEYISERNLWLDRNLTICIECQWEYCTCYDCEDVLRCDDIHNINGYGYCDHCAPNHRPIIRDYGYKPEPIFYGELSDVVKGYYGLELEIDDGYDKREAACAIQDAGGEHIYLKHDGSLSEDGFEIVTHPATLEHHMHTMPWRDIIRVARDYNYTSHDAGTCGLHIHASRSLFGATRAEQDLNIAKCILLIDFWWEQYIVPFSRRNYNQLNEWAKKPNAYITASDSEYDAICKAKQTSEYDRYKAVNLKNRHTVEFRFFRGTLRQDTIIASIQFIDTLIKYVSGVQLADLWDKTWKDVFGNTQYAELKDYLQKRKLLDESEEI
jgi:hypothetical protein